MCIIVVRYRMDLKRLLWCITSQSCASFHLLTHCQKRFLWKVDILLHIQSLVLCPKQEMWKSFFLAPGLEGLDPFLRLSKQGQCLTATEEDGSDKRLTQLKLAYKVYGVTSPDPL